MNKTRIVKGSDATIYVDLEDRSTGRPYPLDGFTSASGFFPNDDDSTLTLLGTLVSSDLGKISFTLTEVQTAELEAGEEQDFEIVVNQGSQRTIVQFEGALEIVDRFYE